MKICKRDPIAEISEKLTEELTKQINQHIVDDIKNKFSNYHIEPDKCKKKRKKYEDKFEVRIVGDNVMPYRVQHFIHSLIEKDLRTGKITRKDEHYEYEISLDDIHKVTYIYNPMIDKDKVIRMHQTEEEYKKSQEPLQPVFLNYELDLTHTPTIGNFNETIAKGEYYTKGKYYIENNNI